MYYLPLSGAKSDFRLTFSPPISFPLHVLACDVSNLVCDLLRKADPGVEPGPDRGPSRGQHVQAGQGRLDAVQAELELGHVSEEEGHAINE